MHTFKLDVPMEFWFMYTEQLSIVVVFAFLISLCHDKHHATSSQILE